MAPPRPNGGKWCFESLDRLNTIFQEILNLIRHQNRINGSRVTAILLNWWIFPSGQSGEASRWRVFYQQGIPRLVSKRFGRVLCSYSQALVKKKNGFFLHSSSTWGNKMPGPLQV